MANEKTVKANDLAAFDKLTKAQNDGMDVAVKSPGGDDLGITIKVAGPDSKQRKDAESKQVNKRLQKRSTAAPTAEDLGLASVEILADSTMAWTGVVLDGDDLPFSQVNALMLYQRFPWMREQVEVAAGSRADFLESLQKSSVPASETSPKT